MQILVLKPYAGKTLELEHCQQVARPDTEVHFENIRDAFPITHVHHNYFKHKAVDVMIERVLQAEEQGYDAVCIACGADPGLLEVRELVDIPVTGTFEAAGHLACTMGHKFSVVTTVSYSRPNMEELALRYGFGHKLASVRTLEIPGRLLYAGKTPEQDVVQRVHDVARTCVEMDGAEVIVLTATLAGVMFTKHVHPPVAEVGAPVVDALLVAFKQAEMLVDLQRLAGLPAVSRIGSLRTPYEPEYRELRAYYNLPLIGAGHHLANGLQPAQEPIPTTAE